MLHDPKPLIGNNDWYSSIGVVNIAPGGPPVSYVNPGSFALQWEDINGNVMPASSLPAGLSWEIIFVMNPCTISGNPGTDIIQLGSGLTAPAKKNLFDQVLLTPPGCPLNTNGQLIGSLSIVGAAPNAVVVLDIN